MKNNHHPVSKIRVCDLNLGDKIKLTAGEFEVKEIDETRITCKNRKGWTQYFGRNSQQYVELIETKTIQYETKDKNKEAESFPVSDNGKVCQKEIRFETSENHVPGHDKSL